MNYNHVRTEADVLNRRNATDYWRVAYLVFSILIIGSLSSFSSSAGIVAFGLMIVGLLFDKCIPFCIYLVCNVLNISFTTSLSSLGTLTLLLILSYSLLRNSSITNRQSLSYAFILFGSLFLSYLFGPNSSFIKFLSIIITLLIFFSFGTFYNKGKEPFIIISLVTVGLFVGISTWMGIRTGTTELLNDVKLSYRENIRTLANACAFPFVYYTCLLIHSISNNIILRKWWIIALSLLFGFLLINSYSRGTIVASICAVLVYALMVNRRTRVSNRVHIFLLLAGFGLLAAEVDVASDTMYDDTSMLARSELWTYLFSETTKNPLTVLFGLGTGDMREYMGGSVFDGYYTHSLLLDYYFCYGLSGFILFVTMLYHILTHLMKNNQRFMVAVFVLAVLMFFSHGQSTSLLFYGIMGLSLGRIYTYKNSNSLL